MATAASHGINFINKDQARGVLASLFKHVADTACTHANKHFNEVRAADAKESSIGLSGDGFCQKRFTRSGRANHKNAFGDAAAEALELLGIFKELHQLRHFFDSFLNARYVFEGRFVAFFGQEAGLALAKAQGTLAGHFNLANEEEPNQCGDDDEGQNAHSDTHEHRIRLAWGKLGKAVELLFHAWR